MLVVALSLATVLAWGSWMVLTQNIPYKSTQLKTLWVSVGALLACGAAALAMREPVFSAGVFWLPFAGGLVWSLASLSGFVATEHLGIARAQGMWAPLNIVVSLAWGALLFGEQTGKGPEGYAILGASLTVIVGGILLIVTAGDLKDRSDSGGRVNKGLGFLGVLGAGVLWGSYFIPVQLSSVSLWTASFPLAVGIFAGSLAQYFFRQARLAAAGQVADGLSVGGPASLARTIGSGALWAVGNYASLLLMKEVGTGRGFTISQLALVVATLWSMLLFSNPPFRSRAGAKVLSGMALAVAGAVILGLWA